MGCGILDSDRCWASVVADAILALDASKLDDQALSILVKTSTRGSVVTASQRQKREQVLQQAGVQLPANSSLLQIAVDPASQGQVSTKLSVGESSDSSLSDGLSPQRCSDKHSVERLPVSQAPNRDLSQRSPPAIVKFGRRGGGTDEHDTSSILKKDQGNTAPTPAWPSVAPNQVRDEEELRRQMIASGEIQGVLFLSAP